MNYITPHTAELSYQERCQKYGQTGQIIWLTGLSGSGKTTLATRLEKQLIANNKIVCVLDGDSLRHGLNSDLGFDMPARKENIRRIAEIAVYLAKQAIIVLVSAISPHQIMRQYARDLASKDNILFTEIYVKASVEVCCARDPKGLYKEVKSGKLKNFTGIDVSYEPPEFPELVLNTENANIEACLQMIKDFLF